MRWTVIFLAFSLFCLELSGKFYTNKDESGDLYKYANAVVLHNTTTVTVKSINSVTHSRKKKIMVINKEGQSYASLNIVYNKFRKIKTLSGNIYDSQGKRLRRIRTSDFSDHSYSRGYPGYEDTRIKNYTPEIAKYPYIVEYEYELELSGTHFLPSWQPVFGYNLTVLKSDFSLNVSNDLSIRYNELNLNDSAKIYTANDFTIYKWEVSDIPAVRFEPLSIGLRKTTPWVQIAPNNFELDGYRGNMETWQKYGQWFWELNKGRNKLPEPTRQKMIELTKNFDDPVSKAKAIYEYMQKNTRYVSIQLGIGGLQSIDAETVDRVGYGDCKALTNYTKSLLESVGIYSIYTLVYASKDFIDIDVDFPSNQFNHVILCVPIDNDTIWLECTNSIGPFGYLGKFTSDRHVLLIDEKNSTLVKTPTFKTYENSNVTSGKIIVDETGNGIGKFHSSFSGYHYEQVQTKFFQTTDEQKRWLSDNLSGANITIGNFNFSNYPGIFPEGAVDFEVSLSRFASSTQRRIFVPLKPIVTSYPIPPVIENRKSDFFIKYPFQYIDTISIQYPENYLVEYMPADKDEVTDFGEYSAQYAKISPNELQYIYRVFISPGIYAAELYSEFVNFFSSMATIGNVQTVLVIQDDE